MAWLLLVVAGLAEIGWVFQMKSSDGFARLGPAVAAVLIVLQVRATASQPSRLTICWLVTL